MSTNGSNLAPLAPFNRPKGVVSTSSAPRKFGAGVNVLDQISEAARGVTDLVAPATSRILMHKCSGSSCEKAGLGTGFYTTIGQRLFVGTAAHVADIDKCTTVFSGLGGSEFDLKLVGIDPVADVALFEMDSQADVEPLKIAPLIGDRYSIQKSEWLLAVGNPLGLGKDDSVPNAAYGSAMDFHFAGEIDPSLNVDMIGHDALIAPGNSGGSLVNSKGELVGVNVAGFIGIGIFLSTPMSYVLALAASLSAGSTRVRFAGFDLVDSPKGPMLYANQLKATKFNSFFVPKQGLKPKQGAFKGKQVMRMNQDGSLHAFAATQGAGRVVQFQGENIGTTADLIEMLGIKYNKKMGYADATGVKGAGITIETGTLVSNAPTGSFEMPI
jgi:S1-C subfamily serine protease